MTSGRKDELDNRLEELFNKPEPHPLSKFFKQYGVSQQKIAIYMGTTQAIVSNWLRGYTKPSEKNEKKLQELVNKIKELVE